MAAAVKPVRIANLWLFQFLADFAAVSAAYYTTLLIRFHVDWGEKFFTAVNRMLGVRETGLLGWEFEQFYTISAPRIIIFITIAVCSLYSLRDLYPNRRFLRPRLVAWDIVAANVIALAVFYTYFYLRRNVFHPRSIFATVIFFNIFFCMFFRGVTSRWLDNLRSRLGIDRRPAILVGRTKEADFVKSVVDVLHPHGICIAARTDFDPEEPFESVLHAVRAAAREHDAAMVIAGDKSFTVPQVMQLLDLAAELDVETKVLSNDLEVLISRAGIHADSIGGTPLVHFDAVSREKAWSGVRRAVYRAAAAASMVVVLPLLALLVLLVKLTSRGPAFFVQERIGFNRRPFRMFKLRTMYDRADELQAQVEEFNESGEGLFKMKKDPRITPVGRFLRRFSLDEMPQLLNVLRGEMTLVGPRPLPRRDFENYYEEWHYARHKGLPGLTCLWQVSGRSDIGFHDMCILDIYYLSNQGWILDLRIILRTIFAVLFAKGAY